MLNNRNKLILVPILAATLIGGTVFYLIKFEPLLEIQITAIILLAVSILVIPLYRSFKQARDLKHKLTIEDEMSRLVEIHAGAYAFRYSMWFWFMIFIFRDKFPDSEEMLGIGMMGSAALYGLIWLYLKKTGLPHADQT